MQQSLILMYSLTILKGYENGKDLLYSLGYSKSCTRLNFFLSFFIFVNKINLIHNYFLQELRGFEFFIAPENI